MEYKNIVKGIFVERPNRFIAKVKINDNLETVHVKNTGRCKELLMPGTTVFLEKSDNPNRKTKYDLIAVKKIIGNNNTILINMDSQIPNYVAEEWLKNGNIFSESAIIKREVTYKNSRFDFYIEDGERKVFLEVKGCTLENNGIAMFPDAPTERGVKHINELIACIDDGYEAYILFIIQMSNMREFKPNDITHPQFGAALRKAQEKGVKILAVDCEVTENSIIANNYIKVTL